MTKRIGINITGRVQGVGFRPTVYQYATILRLTGSVCNSTEGVEIQLQGEKQKIDLFIHKIKTAPPPQAEILSFFVYDLTIIENEKEFIIVKSDIDGEKNVLISPDLATCNECLAEINDPKNRRYNYPFTNCTNCGPRFTIINDRPYDRPLTTMGEFEMCPSCQSEYEDPMDRRFHAQPNACSACGPVLHLIGAAGDPLPTAVQNIKEGKVVAIKGLGGFNLACLPSAVPELRRTKKRPHKAFAVMMKNLSAVERYCFINDQEKDWLKSAQAPIVLLRKKTGELDNLSPDNNYVGVMLPYTPLHHLLMNDFSLLVMTSANLKDEPIAIDDDDIKALIEQGIASLGLSHNRKIAHRADDSLLQVIDGKTQVIRLSRGFTPARFNTGGEKNLLALGANMKNSFALRKGKEIFLSQHIGELIDFRNYEYQKEQIEDLASLLEVPHDNVYGDAHPGYENASKVQTAIYHHHAHLLSVMGEHNLLGREVLGIIADGTGFGVDETIWGYEFLSISQNHKKFKRVAHLKPFPLPGGERAIKEIDRIAIALGGKGFSKQVEIEQLIQSNLNCPKTSSLGRLFDGICALLKLADVAEYEGRGAILLQKEAERCPAIPDEEYPIVMEGIAISTHELVAEIINDIDTNHPTSIIAYKFHQWVVKSMLHIIDSQNAKIVAFSGGCFQNRLLVSMLRKELKVDAYFNEIIPTNDGGISAGQAFY